MFKSRRNKGAIEADDEAEKTLDETLEEESLRLDGGSSKNKKHGDKKVRKGISSDEDVRVKSIPTRPQVSRKSRRTLGVKRSGIRRFGGRSRSGESSSPSVHSVDMESLTFVDLKNLPQLPRIEENERGHFMGSCHKFESSITGFKMRVRLLKYPSLTEKSEWPGDFLLLDDRVFSWQEKILSCLEAEEVCEKRRLETDLEEGKELIKTNPPTLGHLLYSYTNLDHFVVRQVVIYSLNPRPYAALVNYDLFHGRKALKHVFFTHKPRQEAKAMVKKGVHANKLGLAGRVSEASAELRTFDSEEESEWHGSDPIDLGVKGRDTSQTKLFSSKRLSADPEVAKPLEMKRKESEIKKEEDKEITDKVSKKVEVRWSKTKRPSRPIWRVTHRRFLERSGIPPPQCMYIMATIPHYGRKKREICVCSVKAHPSYGVLTLKPPFGYRILTSKRHHVYRLMWELFSPDLLTSSQSKRNGMRVLTGGVTTREKGGAYSARTNPLLDDMGVSFETIPVNEVGLVVMGEILTAEGYSAEPLCVHYMTEIPKGWKNVSLGSGLQGITHNCYTTEDGTANFSHDFFLQLAFSMDSVNSDDSYQRPTLLLMVVSVGTSGRVGYEGYGYLPIPSCPGTYTLRIQTWRPKPRLIVERMQNTFLDLSPSLQDLHAAHIPLLSDQQSGVRLANRLGLESEPTGFVKVRLHVMYQTPSGGGTGRWDQRSKLDLLEKMSSATILKSVQSVIQAFHRAKNRAIHVKQEFSNNYAT